MALMDGYAQTVKLRQAESFFSTPQLPIQATAVIGRSCNYLTPSFLVPAQELGRGGYHMTDWPTWTPVTDFPLVILTKQPDLKGESTAPIGSRLQSSFSAT